MINGGSAGWFGLDEGEETGEGEVAGEDVVSNVGAMMAVILNGRLN